MYKKASNGCILREPDGVCIPPDSDNPDYAEYLAWVDEGNAAEPWESLRENPSEQARAELDALERETMMNRGMREFLMVSMQDLAQRQSEQMAEQGIEMSPKDILNSQSAWVKLVAINEQATQLRMRIN